MALQFPQYNYMDYGKIVSQGEAIKGQRLRNQAASAEIQAYQDQTKNRKRAHQIRQQFENTPAQIEALETEGLFKEADQLRESYIKQSVGGIQMIDALREGVNKENYKEFRSKMLQSGAVDPDFLPVEYSDDWFRKESESRKKTFSQLTRKWEEQGAIFSEQIERDNQGNITWRSGPMREDKEGEKSFSMKAADSNAISRYATELYGGMWDPMTQRFSGLNKDQAKDVAAISERAAKIYSANEGRIPHAEAVSRAARQMGIDIRDLTRERQEASDDPLNIRRKLPFQGQIPLRPN